MSLVKTLSLFLQCVNVLRNHGVCHAFMDISSNSPARQAKRQISIFTAIHFRNLYMRFLKGLLNRCITGVFNFF